MTVHTHIARQIAPTPRLNDLCAICGHRYGDHYVTFDEDNAGCSNGSPSKFEACPCQGYAPEP